MGKFVIECPRCGAYQEAATGIFAKKTLNCVCGRVIDVKKDRFKLVECAHCSNTVVYDQKKGNDCKCPVCNHNLVAEPTKNATASNFDEISCPSCACELTVNKGIKNFTCPLCHTEIDVQHQIEKEEIRKKGLASVIKYEGGNDVLVWKHPIEDFNLGSQLIVHESQEAIFFRDGQALDCFGAGRYTLATQQLPLLENLYKLPVGDNVFHSEVYFVNMVTQTGIKWGTDSKVRMFDPQSGLHIELGASGEFNLRVSNARKLLIKLVGTTSELRTTDVINQNPWNVKLLTGKFKALVVTKVKAVLAKVIKENQINVLEIDEHLERLSSLLKTEINYALEDYGLTIPEFFVTNVLTPDDDPNFRRMKQQYAEQYLLVRDQQIKKDVALAEQARRLVEAQTGAQEEIIAAQARAEAYRLQAEAEAREMQMKGYTYQQETSRMVGIAAVENQGSGNGNGMVGNVSGMVGDVMGLGITLGAVGNVVNMTKDALSPVAGAVNGVLNAGANAPEGWTCSCGQSGITSNFCPNCGSAKPQPKPSWNCSCGQSGITSNFCPNCGSAKPVEEAGWDCACGQKGIKSKFCPNCGSAKPVEDAGWDCACGQTGIKTQFCPNCGSKRGA